MLTSAGLNKAAALTGGGPIIRESCPNRSAVEPAPAQPRPGSRWFLVAWLATASSGVIAQTPCAHLETLGSEIAASRDSNPAAGVQRGDQALADARALPSPCPIGSAMLLGGIATNLHILGRNSEAVQRYQEAIIALGEAGSASQIAFLHRGLGVTLVDLESYESALSHYLTAIAASDGANDRIESAKTAGNIGILYTTLGDLDQARNYHGRSLEGFEAAGFKPGIAGALINLGAVAAKFGEVALSASNAEVARHEHDTLKSLNERALTLFEELKNPRGIAYAASNIGLALDRLGKPALALAQHEHSLALRREIGDVFGTVNSLLSLGTTLTTLERYGSATKALDEAASLIPEGSHNLRMAVAEQRVLLDEARGDFRGALAAQREVSRLTALIASEDQRSEVANLQNRFDAEQATKQIDRLRGAAQTSEDDLQRQRLLFQLSALAALLALGMFVVMLSRYRIGVTAARTLKLAARTDPLTCLPNRRHLIERMDHEAARVARGNPSFCLLMADLDDFKAINDRHGHDAGDAVLVEVARRLRDTVRKLDTVARWGGEEFLLLLPQSNAAGALILADKLRDRIAATPILVGKSRQPVDVTMTVGYSEFQLGVAIDDCIKAADAALYEGKRQGKNRSGTRQHGVA